MAGPRSREATDRQPRAEVLQELRKKLAATAPKVRGGERPPLPTGWPALDELLGGGLPRGKVVEAMGPTGRMSLTCAALAAATAGGHLAAMVDGPGALEPRAIQDAGGELDRVLWCQPREATVRAALQVAGVILEVEAIVLVAIYAVGLAGRPGPGAWLRLQQRAAQREAAVLVLSDRPLCGSFSAATLSLQRGPALWQRAPGDRLLLRGQEVQAQLGRARWEGAAGGAAATRLFKGP